MQAQKRREFFDVDQSWGCIVHDVVHDDGVQLYCHSIPAINRRKRPVKQSSVIY